MDVLVKKTRRLAFVTEYLGTNYSGWQSQDHGNTVCDVLTKAVSQVVNHEVLLFASGRTDLGVHAYRQYVHFDTAADVNTGCFCLGVNTKLPMDIAVRKCFEVSDKFDARKSAIDKTYLYKMYISPTRSPLKDLTHAQNYFLLDVKAMREAAKVLVGTHDFEGFRATGGYAHTSVRTVYEIRIEQPYENELHFYVRGNVFLYNMVRIIVGTLVYVGKGKIKTEDMESILLSKDRSRAGKTMPPQGLHLYDVTYPSELFVKQETRRSQSKNQ
jgi:tRNA pseudouridine38-40 synthase